MEIFVVKAFVTKVFDSIFLSHTDFRNPHAQFQWIFFPKDYVTNQLFP